MKPVVAWCDELRRRFHPAHEEEAMSMFVKLFMTWALTRRSYIGRHRFPRDDQRSRVEDELSHRDAPRDA